MKNISVWLVVVVMIAIASRYAYLIKKRRIAPTISTWMIFLAGTVLSVITYALAEKRDLRSGILNAMDVGVCLTVLVALYVYGEHGIRLKRFEKWYLAAAGAIVAYGLLTGDAWSSNILTQVLISAGYFPTVHKLYVEKKNTESFSGWGGGIVSGTIAVYPAAVDGNALAVIYALRSVAMTAAIIAIMLY